MLMLVVDWRFFKDTLFSIVMIEVEVEKDSCNWRSTFEKVIVIYEFVF